MRWPALLIKILVHGGHFRCLLLQLVFIHAAGSIQSLGMISDRDVCVAARGRPLLPSLEGSGAVTPLRVHLQIALQRACPSGTGCQNGLVSQRFAQRKLCPERSRGNLVRAARGVSRS
jgi:hypothetical protein